MTKYVTFLRGINVGGRIIKMADLQDCFAAMGFSAVATFLQSGNVTFESAVAADQLKPEIEAGLTGTFNYPAKVQVMPIDSLREIIAANPFAAAPENHHQYVIFFENGLEKDFATESASLDDEEVRAGRGVAYWRVEKGKTLKSSVGKLLTKSKYKDFHTNRNVRTLRKIAEAT